jgi:hypothetical protein
LESKGSIIIALTRYKNVKAEFLFTNTCWRKKGKKRKIARAIRATRLILRDRQKIQRKKSTDFSP